MRSPSRLSPRPSATEPAAPSISSASAVAYEYPVHFTERLFAPHNPVLRDTITRLEPDRRHRCIVFVDDGLCGVRPEPDRRDRSLRQARMLPRSSWSTAPVKVPGGEKIKNELFHVEWMQGLIQEHRIDRHSFVIAVGGGAVLDAVGLVAATSHRGIRLIRVPTTVLSQNDSGVGVKNSVNLKGSQEFRRHLRAAFRRAQRSRASSTTCRRARRSRAWPKR